MTIVSTQEQPQALNPRPVLSILSGVADVTTSSASSQAPPPLHLPARPLCFDSTYKIPAVAQFDTTDFSGRRSIPLRLFPEIKTCPEELQTRNAQADQCAWVFAHLTTGETLSTAQRIVKSKGCLASTPTHHPQFQNCVLRSLRGQERSSIGEQEG
ncbi:hypothetical protein MJT46_010362 [Ovis ammon polii x Ovis aries]|nr:hypothetical protein MJT46_010362 [Ovis ammon polii x Ovis aries]